MLIIASYSLAQPMSEQKRAKMSERQRGLARGPGRQTSGSHTADENRVQNQADHAPRLFELFDRYILYPLRPRGVDDPTLEDVPIPTKQAEWAAASNVRWHSDKQAEEL